MSGCGTSLGAIHGSGDARLMRGLTVRGWSPPPKLTRRIWRDERLQRPPQRKAKRHRLTDGTAARLRAQGPNDVGAGRPTSTNQHTRSTWTHKRVPLSC